MRFSVHGAIAPRLAVLCAVTLGALCWSASALAAAPEVASESFSEVGSASATLSAQVNPGGLATTYEFEYGPSEAYGSTTPVASAGLGSEPAGALADLSGLASETEYHFRIVAVNEAGTTRGEDRTFRTFPSSLVGLPDGRVFEMVSPSTNQDGNVYVPYTPQISGNSEAGVPTQRPFDVAPSGDAVAYVGDPPSIGGNGSIGQGVGNDFVATRSPEGGWTATDIEPPGYRKPEYLAFSSELSVGILAHQPPKVGFTGPWFAEQLYVHPLDGESSQPFAGTVLHRSPEEFQLTYAAGSSDLGHVLFAANDALPGTGAVDGGSGQYNLYDLAGGVLYLVNVLPDGATEAGASFGSTGLDRVVSADGSRIFWTDTNTGALYVRENDTQPQSPVVEGRCTVPTDACTVLVAGAGQFWTASTDGSKVFFTKGELYEYDLESGQTTDLSPGVDVAGVVGAGEDGEYVYYADESSNLELWHAGVTTTIAALPGDDSVEPYVGSGIRTGGDWQEEVGQRTAEVAPDGRSVVFMSTNSLTGYDNQGMEEVFDYDVEQGRLTCVSCDPSGEVPPGTGLIRDYRIGGLLPVSWHATYQPRLISRDGSRVFFDSPEPLVSNDTNGQLDVYEWERSGSGSCQRSAGCLYLLSGGTSTDNSYLIGAGESGADVFVVTRAQLVAQDRNGDDDLYDARVGGVQPLTPPACTGSGCQGVPAAPPFFATPASATFAGIGNFAAPSSSREKAKPKPKRKRSKKIGKRRKHPRAKRASDHSHTGGKAGRS